MTRLILVNRYFHPDESATAQFATDLALHLGARREVIVLTSRQRLEDPDAALPREQRFSGISIRRLGSTRFGRGRLAGRAADYLTFLLSVAAWLLLHARRGDVVLAKTDPPLLGVVTTLATLGRAVRRVQWLQDLYPETAVALGVVSADGVFTRAARALRNWSLRHSALIVTVSRGMALRLRDAAGTARIEHIPNWSEDFAAPAGHERAPDSALVVGYSGNLGRAHPIDALLQLVEGPAEPGVRFIFAGGGTHYDRLRERVGQLQRTEWTFLPYQPRSRLAEHLREPDLHLVILDPRVEHDIFPSKLFGILSAGRPILHLGDAGGEVATLLHEHGCGWSVAADSAEALRAKLRELRAEPGQLARAGRRARDLYEKQFSKARALAHWDESLAALTDHSPLPHDGRGV